MKLCKNNTCSLWNILKEEHKEEGRKITLLLLPQKSHILHFDLFLPIFLSTLPCIIYCFILHNNGVTLATFPTFLKNTDSNIGISHFYSLNHFNGCLIFQSVMLVHLLLNPNIFLHNLLCCNEHIRTGLFHQRHFSEGRLSNQRVSTVLQLVLKYSFIYCDSSGHFCSFSLSSLC